MEWHASMAAPILHAWPCTGMHGHMHNTHLVSSTTSAHATANSLALASRSASSWLITSSTLDGVKTLAATRVLNAGALDFPTVEAVMLDTRPLVEQTVCLAVSPMRGIYIEGREHCEVGMVRRKAMFELFAAAQGPGAPFVAKP